MPSMKFFTLTLRREIALILIIKLMAVVALYQLYFDEPVAATKAPWLAPVAPASAPKTQLPNPQPVTEEESP